MECAAQMRVESTACRVRFDIGKGEPTERLLQTRCADERTNEERRAAAAVELFGSSVGSDDAATPRFIGLAASKLAECGSQQRPIVVLPDVESDIDEDEDARVEQLGSDVAALWRHCATNMYRRSKTRARCAVATVRPDAREQRHPRVVPNSAVAATTQKPVRTEVSNAEIGEVPVVLDENGEKEFGSVLVLRAAAKMARRRHRLQHGSQDRIQDGVEPVPVIDRTTRRECEAVEARRLLERRRKFTAALGSTQKKVSALPLRKRVCEDEKQVDPAASVQVVEADDGLPTARLKLEGKDFEVKLDTGARYTVAGTDWMRFGDRRPCVAPVDVVEGIGGFQLDVIGVWRFVFQNVFGQEITIDACIISGCTTEFLVGSDFFVQHGAEMDFRKHEMRFTERKREVIVPFRTFQDDGPARVYTVRAASRTKIDTQRVVPIEVAVAAEDGEVGVFLPRNQRGPVMLGATVSVARGGKAVIPLLNVNGSRIKLPSQEELGTWVPIDEHLEILEMDDQLSTERVHEWVERMEGSDEPLQDEVVLDIGVKDPAERGLILRLLRRYRAVLESDGDCPPAASCGVQHHIDTGDHAPIMQKRRRHAQHEQTIIDANVKKMLASGVI